MRARRRSFEGRVRRLLRPSAIFLGLWAIAQIALHVADVGRPVLLFPHQLGFFYAEGRLGSPVLHRAMVVAGLGGLVLLTTSWAFRVFGEARFDWFPGIGHCPKSLLAMLALWPLGFGREVDSTARWWLERPLWIVVPALVLAAFVLVFGRLERAAVRPPLMAGRPLGASHPARILGGWCRRPRSRPSARRATRTSRPTSRGSSSCGTTRST